MRAPSTILDKVIPNKKERIFVLSLLNIAITYARSLAPNAYGVTLFETGFRLNVGQVEAFVLHNKKIRVNLVGIENTTLMGDPRIYDAGYKSIPAPNYAFEGSIKDLIAKESEIRPYLFSFIEIASKGPKSGKKREGSPFASSHSTKLEQYVAEVANAENLIKYLDDAVFAIASEAAIRSGKIEENRSWIAIKKKFDELDSNTKLVLLLENAADFRGVEWAAVIRDIRIAGNKTAVSFNNLIQLKKVFKKDKLIKTVDGSRLDPNYRRSYVPCKLPKLISQELETFTLNNFHILDFNSINFNDINQSFCEETTKRSYQHVRTTQGEFRDKLIRKWGVCMVTGFTNPKVLVASHIVPWASANNFERQDVFNGLLLVAHLDRLFDEYLISFDKSGKILISRKLSVLDQKILGISTSMKLCKVSVELEKYLARHRRKFKAALLL